MCLHSVFQSQRNVYVYTTIMNEKWMAD